MLLTTFIANALLLLTSFGTKILVNAPRTAEAAFNFPPPVALISEDVDPLLSWWTVIPVVDHLSLRMVLVADKPFVEQELVAPFINVTPTLSTSSPIASCSAADQFSLCASVSVAENQNTAALAAACGRGLVIARDVMYSLVETLVPALIRFLDGFLSLFPSEYVEAAAAECPYWGLFLFWFYFVTCLYLPLISVLVSVTQITAFGYTTWKGLHLRLDHRPTLEAPTPPSCKCVQFSSEETSLLSVHEYPRAFKTVADKARLYWTFEEMEHFKLEYKAELKFRAKLKCVLAQKQEDQQRREAEWQLELEMKCKLDEATKSGALEKDKAMLNWTFEEMGHFGMEYIAELKFRATLNQVLIRKQEDQLQREAEWWLESQMKLTSDRATRTRVEDLMEPERKRRRLN